jgi:phosphatidylinositol 4-kinase
MGILLPPVSQVTTVTTLTMHHRNRSLDSALQRIPEVDITPSPECEPTERVPGSAKAAAGGDCAKNKTGGPPVGKGRDREEITSLGSDDSGILCGSDSGSGSDANTATRESSVEQLTGIDHSHESLDLPIREPSHEQLSHTNYRNKSCVDCPGSVKSCNDHHEVETHTKDVDFIPVTPTIEVTQLAVDVRETNDESCASKCSHSSETGGDHSGASIPATGSHSFPMLLSPSSMTLCCGGSSDTNKSERDITQIKGAKGFLLRLFESKMFDMSMAITYLFNSKEPGVQSYIGENVVCIFVYYVRMN